jgi:hypothetical protein
MMCYIDATTGLFHDTESIIQEFLIIKDQSGILDEGLRKDINKLHDARNTAQLQCQNLM